MADVAVAPAPPAGAAPAAERPDFEIVPRRGLPIVALVLCLLIAGIAVNK